VTDARTLNVWRRWGYRLLPGDLFSYVLHLRPREWPIMAAHTALGYVLAVGLRGVGRGEHLTAALGALALWVVCLNGGTLALNSVFDNDEGDIGYLTAPPPLPARLFEVSVGLLVVGQAAAFALPLAFRLDYALCFLLSLLYSVPPFRCKAVAGVDWAINMWGFGTLTPFATWAATGRPLDSGQALVLLAFCPLFAALYPLTQLYQLDEDRRRGDRTLAVRLGVGRSLALAIGCMLVAFALFVWAARVLRTGAAALVLGIPLASWLAVLVPWAARHRDWGAAEHQRGMYRALGAWAVTDLAVVVVFAR
jgi:4-hydroxybenzoate polyprenyltransferase